MTVHALDRTDVDRTVPSVQLRPTQTMILAAAATVGVLLTATLWRAAERASGVVAILVISLFAAAACEPLVNRLHQRRWRRGLATGTVLGSVLVLFLAGVFAVGATVVSQAQELRSSFPLMMDELETFIGGSFGVTVNLDGVSRKVNTLDLPEIAADAAGSAVRILAQTLAVLLVTFYLVVDGPKLRKRLCSLLPARHQGEVLRVWDLAVDKTGSYLASKVVLAVASTAVHAVAFTLLGVPYPLPMAIWVGVVSQIVPVIGTYLAVGLPLLLVLSTGNLAGTMLTLLVVTVYQQIENTVLSPRLTGQAVQIHPMVGFVGVIAAAAAYGPVYTLLAVPLLATVQGFVSAYVKTHELIDDPRLHSGGRETIQRKPKDRKRPNDQRPAGRRANTPGTRTTRPNGRQPGDRPSASKRRRSNGRQENGSAGTPSDTR